MSVLSPERLARRGKDILAGFTTGQRVVTVLGAAALVLAALTFYRWASKPDYVPLFSGLATSDASAITQKLAADKEPYQLSDGGQTILVPQKDVYAERLKMSADGLPAGTVSGYSLLDKQGITTSEFQQHVQYQRALEGELTKTIMAMDGVDGAVVHLVVPNQDVFAADSQQPSASVLIKTAAGQQLSPDAVQSVVHLVASSVEGLQPDQVTVADATGRLLSTAGSGMTDTAVGSTQAEQQQQFDDRLSTQVQSMVDKLVGPGHSSVQVNADLDFDQKNTKTERYVAASPSPAPLSESKSVEKYNGAGGAATGVLGATGTTGAGPNGANKYSKSTDTRDNAVDKETVDTIAAPGSVRTLKVAVLLDQRTAAAVNLAQLKALVSSAVGAVPTRGDQVTVQAMPFDQTLAAQAAKELAQSTAAQHKSDLFGLVRTVAVLLVVAIVLLLAIRSSRKSQRSLGLSPSERLELEEARQALAIVEARPVERAPELPALPAQRVGSPGPSDAERKREVLRDEIGDLVERQPDEVAQLLRGWLADRRS